MIKVNLLPVKKKKAKPVPSFLFYAIGLFVVVCLVLGYMFYFYSSRLSERQAQFRANEQKIAELKAKIKEVEDFEQRNAVFQKRKEVIEQLGKNKTLPVKMIDEVSALLPPGVWLTALDFKGQEVSLGGSAFTNSDVVNYVNGMKSSKMFSDVFLQESVQATADKTSVYNFKLKCKVQS